MTVWRRHEAGLSYAITENYLKNYEDEKRLYSYLNEFTGNKFTKEIEAYLRKMRTDVVFNSIKSFRYSNFKKIGWISVFKIN